MIAYVRLGVDKWSVVRLDDEVAGGRFEWLTSIGWRFPSEEFNSDPNAEIAVFGSLTEATKRAHGAS